jgi:hypothetical protein
LKNSLWQPPINITNVLPAQSPQASLPVSQADTPASVLLSNPTPISRLDIPGQRDIAVKEYNDWQQSKVHNEIFKDEFKKARDIVLADSLDLKQIHRDQDRAVSLRIILVKNLPAFLNPSTKVFILIVLGLSYNS